MDLEDLLSLMRSVGAASPPTSEAPPVSKPKTKRKKTQANRNLSKALKIVNKKARLKNGSLRKGYTQSRIMKDAQRMARRM
tara:strand:- start:32 stop:274 length:243 start_codon:yes stop_codon:yes gene_type:complete